MEPSESGRSMGHEAIGIVDAVGAGVQKIKRGDLACEHLAYFGNNGMNGAQAEALRIPFADGTLYPLGLAEDHALMPSLLTLSDVMGTGHHAAVIARVNRGSDVAVVGDGAVGLCAVIAAKRLGAERIIIMGRHPDRIALAQEFGATDVVSERGDEAVAKIRELTGGLGVYSVLECVGHGAAIETAIKIARPGGAVGRVRVPQEPEPGVTPGVFRQRHDRRRTCSGARLHRRAIARHPRGHIEPGRVFDRTVALDGVRTGTGRWPTASRSRSWSSRDRQMTSRSRWQTHTHATPDDRTTRRNRHAADTQQH